MSQVRVFTPENRLRHIVEDSAAPTVAELVAAAEANIAKLGPMLREAVDQRCQELARLTGAANLSAAEIDEVGAAALAVCETAPACGLAAAAEAARGLYAVVTALRAEGVWRPDALHAHVGALLTLTTDPPPPPAEGRAVLDHLSALRAFIGLPA